MEAMQISADSASMPVSLANQGSLNPGTYRGVGSSWFNSEKIAAEDWLRGEQSADNALRRSLQQLGAQNDFNAAEAQKSRDWQERMRDTAYLSTVDQMKKAGINPVLAFQQTGSVAPGAATASSGSGGTHQSGNYYRGSDDPLTGIVGAVISLLGGLVAKIPSSRRKIGF